MLLGYQSSLCDQEATCRYIVAQALLNPESIIEVLRFVGHARLGAVDARLSCVPLNSLRGLIMKRGIFSALAFVCLALAGCTTGYQASIDSKAVESFRLERIDVSVAPDAKFWWGDGERSYARSIGRPDIEAQALGASLEGRAYMSALASQRTKAAFDREFAGRFRNGSRPVRIEVTMTDINIASAIQRIVIGGGYSMKASVNLVDAKTGQVIAANPNLSTASAAGQGILGAALDQGDPVDRVASNLASSYRNWLLPGASI
jgi:hypothetical protein